MSLLNIAKRLFRYNFTQIKDPEPPIKKSRKKPEITQLIGQDREFQGNLLFYDIGHRYDWFYSTAKSLRRTDYLRLKRFLNNRVNNKCQLCGCYDQNLQIHERWEQNFKNGIKKLMRLISLCQLCHSTTHMEFLGSLIFLQKEIMKKHIMYIKNWSKQEQKAHAKQAKNISNKRNQVLWNYDMSVLLQQDIGLTIGAIQKRERYERKKIEIVQQLSKLKQTVPQNKSSN